MYASDKDIRAVLSDLDIDCRIEGHPFDDSAIQPCSLDLRVDTVFWEPRRRRGHQIDLTERRLADSAPRYNWKRRVLKHGQTQVLKPGQVLLARTYEKFTVPAQFAGKIEGRSSFARMGLMVHCSGDFVNPGWRGHMPLEIVNFSPSPIKLVPLMSICQLMLVPLTTVPDRSYGDSDLSSKYQNDDGGPSYWWRDSLIEKLLSSYDRTNLAATLREELWDELGGPPFDVLRRLVGFAENLRAGDVTNAPSLADEFARQEDKARLKDKLVHGVSLGGAPLFLAVFLGSLFAKFTPLTVVFAVLTVLMVYPMIRAYRRPLGSYLGEAELAAIRLERAS